MQASERDALIRDAGTLGVPLDATQATGLLELLDELARWSGAYNLTAITDRREMVTLHLLDSLSVHPFLAGATVADVGTGAGFPGLPLAVTNPERRFTLIDSNSKKIRFVSHAVRTLKLSNVEAVHARVEDMKPIAPFDSVVARAFAPLPRLLEQVRPLFGPQTRGLAMKSTRIDEELEGVDPPWRVETVHGITVPGMGAARTLAVFGLIQEGGRSCHGV